MSKYNLNISNLVKGLIPFVFRLALTDLLIVLTLPVQSLHARFMDFRLAMLNRLSYNSQYPNLQRLLNDRADTQQRRIRVYDATNTIAGNIAYNSGQHGKPQLKTDFVARSWQQWGYRPFVVELPAEFQDNANKLNQIIKLVNTYKFAGTKYRILIINH